MRLLVLIPVEERWALPFSFLQNTRPSVDLPPVDTGQFLSPSDGPPGCFSGRGCGVSMVVFWVEPVGLHV